MQIKLRSLMGYLTVACLFLGILRRPLLKVLEYEKWPNIVNEFFMVWYVDFYLLGIEDWFFTSNPFIKTEDLDVLTMLSGSFGIVFYIITHLVALVICVALLKTIFWPDTELSDEECEELLEDEEEIPVGEEVTEDEGKGYE